MGISSINNTAALAIAEAINTFRTTVLILELLT